MVKFIKQPKNIQKLNRYREQIFPVRKAKVHFKAEKNHICYSGSIYSDL